MMPIKEWRCLEMDKETPGMAWLVSFIVSFAIGVAVAVYFRSEIMDFVISALSSIG